ncbi:MAG: hypothetical protein ACRDT6_29140, partial [Micromonosporaceae bacterium]
RVPGTAALLLGRKFRVYGPPGADHLGSYCTRVLGADAPLRLAMQLGGRVRANRKPVVALLDAAGRTVGYAKLGVSPLARSLVRNERAALRTLADAGFPELRLPRLLHGGVWSGHELVVQSALPVTAPAVPDDARRVRAMCQLARGCGVQRSRLTDAPYWTALRARARRTGALRTGALGTGALQTGDRRLAEAVALVDHDAHGSYLEYGAWHGDWTPWNSHPVADAVLLWDWERFATGVPLGYDALHHRLAELLQRDAPGALAVLFGEAVTLLAPFGPAPFGLSPAQARTTTALFAIELATRYLGDGQQTTTARAVIDALLPTLTAQLGGEST